MDAVLKAMGKGLAYVCARNGYGTGSSQSRTPRGKHVSPVTRLPSNFTIHTFTFVPFDFQQTGSNVHESTEDLAHKHEGEAFITDPEFAELAFEAPWRSWRVRDASCMSVRLP